jgi:predicted metal-binding protein
MVKRGADTIVLASCILKGTPIGFPCPHAQEMKMPSTGNLAIP